MLMRLFAKRSWFFGTCVAILLLFTEPNNVNRRFMDTLYMALTIFEVWHYLIESIGDYPALLDMTWCASFFLSVRGFSSLYMYM